MSTLIDAVVADILLRRGLYNISDEKRERYTKRLRGMLEQRLHIAFLDSLSKQEWDDLGITKDRPLSFEDLVKAMEKPERIELFNEVIAEFIDELGQPPIMEVDFDLPAKLLQE